MFHNTYPEITNCALLASQLAVDAQRIFNDKALTQQICHAPEPLLGFIFRLEVYV